MGPKRKLRETADSSPQGNAVQLHSESHADDLDLWTDEQESLLLQTMISLKPVGMHKHFRVIAISEAFRRNGFSLSQDKHLQPGGIWTKLDSLYNLGGLDEIEHVASLNLHASEQDDREPFCDFELDPDEFGPLMFTKRLEASRPLSPLLLPYQLAIDGTHPPARHGLARSNEEGREAPNPSPVAKRGGRASRSRGRGASRGGQRATAASTEDSSEDDDEDTAETVMRGQGSRSKRRSERHR